jgi:hypothetical protein
MEYKDYIKFKIEEFSDKSGFGIKEGSLKYFLDQPNHPIGDIKLEFLIHENKIYGFNYFGSNSIHSIEIEYLDFVRYRRGLKIVDILSK